MKKRSLTNNAILNSFRQVSSMLFSMITFPYVSRIIQATNYGKVSFISSLMGYFSLIASLGISNYAIRQGTRLRDNQRELSYFANQIFSINFYSTLIAYLLLFITYCFWSKLQNYSLLILIQAPIIILTTLGVEWVYTIYEDYLYITIRSVLMQLVSLCGILMFVKNVNDYLIYALIITISSGGANVFNFIHSKKYLNLKLVTKLDLKKHLPPILALFSSAIMISIYVNSDITIIGILKDNRDVGVYTVSVKIYTILKQLLSAVIVVTLPHLSYLLGQNQIKKYRLLMNKILQTLLVFVIPLSIGLILEGKNIIRLIGGNGYLNGTFSLQILSVTIVFSLLGSFITTAVLLPYGQERKILLITSVSAVINLILNFVLIPIGGINGSAFTTMIAELLVATLSFYYSKKFTSINIFTLNILQVIISCIPIIIICIFINSFNFSYILELTFSIILSVFLYFVSLLCFKNKIIISYLKVVKNKL